MTNKLAYRDGGKTSEEGINRITSRLISNAGVLNDASLAVTEAGTPDNTVKVAVGDIVIGDNSPSATAPDYYYHGWVTSEHSETVSANASGNPRIDVIVAFVDLSVVDDTNSDNPGALDFMIVAGTAAASPSPPDDSAIQTAVGASNPWVALAQIAVANGFSSITNSDITDLRPKALTPQQVADKTSNDVVGEGLVFSQVSALVGQITSGFALIGGLAITKGYHKHTFTASKDTYVDLSTSDKPTSADDLTYTAVANGAAAPALAANSIRIAKVVTDGSGITAVQSQGFDNKGVPVRPTVDGYGGWRPAPDTLTYSAYSATTRIATLGAGTNASERYWPGMRLRFNQTTDGIKYGIIHYVSGSNIYVFMHSSYDVDNETITVPYIANGGIPYGFDADPTKWELELLSTTNRVITASATWTGMTDALTVGVGAWKLELLASGVLSVSGNVARRGMVTLSTDGGTTPTTDFIAIIGGVENVSGRNSGGGVQLTKRVLNAAETVFTLAGYLIGSSAQLSIASDGSASPTVIRATSGYLSH